MSDDNFITRHAETLCPNCGHPLNASGDPATGLVPRPGDFSVCIKCAAILIYSDDALHLRIAAPGEIEVLSAEERNDLSEKVATVLAFMITDSMKKR